MVPSPEATPQELAGGLSSTLLRQIDFKAAADQRRKLRAESPATQGISIPAQRLRELIDRDGVSDGYLAHLSEAYIYLVQAGSGTSPAPSGR